MTCVRYKSSYNEKGEWLSANDLGWKKEDEEKGFYNNAGRLSWRFALYKLSGVPKDTRLLMPVGDSELKLCDIDGELYIALTSEEFKETPEGENCEVMLP